MTASPLTGGRTPSALRRLANEVAKFGIVGISGLVVQLVSLSVLLDMKMQPVRANIVATVIAIATNYIGYRYWVYRDSDKKTRSREISLFLVFSAIGLVIQSGVLYLLTYGLDMTSKLETMVGTILGIAVATVFRFWAYRTWVFRVVPQAEEALDAAEQILAAEHVKRSTTVTHRR
ncbi:GtrA family protein [Streptacidiphilus neutrinimicus]|uniref:GtrA family protein n=1 Tax=Streptacidiphilus neutrinimicus TaxID=105420 RepID=UPI0005A60D0D|nr:GtrA family protein [Streptacidiphilus neutrinimicus]